MMLNIAFAVHIEIRYFVLSLTIAQAEECEDVWKDSDTFKTSLVRLDLIRLA